VKRLLSVSFILGSACAASLALAGAPARSSNPKPVVAGKAIAPKVSFAEIQRVFNQQCLGCHGVEVTKGKFSVQTIEALIKGGAGGPVIVAGKSAESRLVQFLEGTLKPQMPMSAPPLPSATIALVKQWINEGARTDTAPVETTTRPADQPLASNLKRVPIDVAIPVSLGETKTPSDEVTFAANIQPILLANCQNCHGTDNPRSQLRISSFDTIMAGGKSGVPVKPGSSAESLLVKRLLGEGGRKMPLNGNLSQPDLDLIKKWVDTGAKRGLPESNRGPEMLVNVGPLAAITALAFSPDGKLLAVGTFKRVLLVELASGNLVRTLDEHGGTINDLAFSNDGKLLAVSGGESGGKGEIKLWNTADWTQAADLKGHTDTVYSVAFNADSKKLVSGSNDKTVRVWELPEGKLATTYKDPADAVYAVAISPDGNLIAGGGADKTVKVWKSGAGLERTLTQATDSVTCVAFSRDGQQIIGAGLDGVVRKWATANGQNVANMGHGDRVQSLALSKDGQVLASGGADRNVKLWNPGNGNIRTLGGHTDWVTAVAVNPDGKVLASGTTDGVLRLFSVVDGRLLVSMVFATVAGKPAPEWIHVTGDGYYHGSPDVLKLVRWRIRGEFKTGDPFTALLKPDQVKKALALEKTDPVKLELGAKPVK